MMKLKWSGVDFAVGYLNFRDTKNGTHRRVKMAPCLATYLKAKEKQGDYVCSNQHGLIIGRSQFQKTLAAFKKQSTLKKDWNPHDLRHSFSYHFLKQGGKVYQLQAILRHKSIGMTVDLYGQLKASDVEKPSPFSP